MSTHDLLLRAKKNNVYSSKLQFYDIKVAVSGCKLHRNVSMILSSFVGCA